VPAKNLAERMGTSIEQISKTYAHLLPDALDVDRAALEAFDAREPPLARREAELLVESRSATTG
jgi:hypothetical protein